ncbi:MAG: hypothetical protein R3254_00255 [Thiomicrorhabdus sp.]|nr:hypothetical protein [Thiomicrorhabdus sp.]
MSTETIFLAKGVVKSKGTKALTAFNLAIPDFTKLSHLKPSEYISTVWSQYKKSGHAARDLNGKVFEYILISLFINKNLLPLYIQAKAAFVPNVDFDLLLYTSEKPIVLSAKTSLRERYKQADLESIALKYVHRRAESYLLTLDETECQSVNNKILKGDVIGINKVILATSEDMDTLINILETLKLERAKTIDIITAQSMVS